jgi:hypothetical protein
MPQPYARAGKPCAAAFIAVWLQFSAQLAFAADLPGGTLTLSAGPNASGCPTEEELAEELRARSPTTPAPAPIYLKVHIDAVDGAYVAEIEVAGRKQGQRTLRTEGPSCQGLHDALIVSLLLLLDDDPDAPATTAPSRATPPPPPIAPIEETPPAKRPRDPRAASLWLELGAAGTHGLPYELSAAFEAGVSFRARRWEVGAAGFWAVPRVVAFEPGRLDVGLWGVSVSGCVVPVELSQAFRLSACGVAAVAELSVEPRGFTRAWQRARPLFLAGLGLEPRYTLGSRVSLGLSLSVSAPLLRERFSVQGLGQGYVTDRVVGKAGVELGFRFW